MLYTLAFKTLGLDFFNKLFSMALNKLIQFDSKDIDNVTKVFYFKLILFFWTFYSSKILKKHASRFPQT